MTYRRAIDLGFVAMNALMIGAGVVAVVAMLLAALAFTTDTTTMLPFVATFVGFRDASGAAAVTIDGSWGGACAVVGVAAVVVASLIARGAHRRAAAVRTPERAGR